MTAGRLFIVEDDDRIRAALRMALEDEGYEVAEAADAESALVRLPAWQPDLLIVDLMLGAVDGYTCIREVRKFSDVPIIVVSARVDTHDIVAGLEAGADDYVTKPFQIKEITARLRALKRRADGGGKGASTLPDTVLDARRRLVLSSAAGTVRLAENEVALTLTEFQILAALAADPGVVLSRTALLGRVWDHSFAGDERLVDAHVRRLRTKIERDPSKPELVVTVRGMGYRLDRALAE
ncbi:MAG: response regulator [Sporichthyaceae bacterium]|jgi:DNA-binding response OmpR family regulator